MHAYGMATRDMQYVPVNIILPFLLTAKPFEKPEIFVVSTYQKLVLILRQDTNSYVADGCHGGDNGFNRAFCVESNVSKIQLGR